HKSLRRKRNSNACEHTERNSTLVSPPWKPAWTHGRVNSLVLETEPHGASQTADSSRALRFLLWVLRRFRGGCRRGVDSKSFLPGVIGWRRQREGSWGVC